MDEKSLFGLDPDQLSQLFSLGTDEIGPAQPPQEGPGFTASGGQKGLSDARDFGATLESSFERVGQWIGPYKLLRLLGEGGWAGFTWRNKSK